MPAVITLPQGLGAAIGWLAAATGILLLLLAIALAIGGRLGLKRWGIPEALLAGTLGLLVAPSGVLPLIPAEVMTLWDGLPLPLLTLVFATLLLGKPLPKLSGLWRPLSGQVLLALTLAFGQYLVAGLAVLFVLQPLLGVHPLMACLIEVAFEGGHGSAAAMGPSYASLGFASGEALGLAMATVGLLAASVIGGIVVVLARRRQGLLGQGSPAASQAPAAEAGGAPEPLLPTIQLLDPIAPSMGPAAWAVNLALAGGAVLLGAALLEVLRWFAPWLGGGFTAVVEALPVFPLAIAGSLLVRLLLEKTGQQGLASAAVQGQVGAISADLLITAATACLDLSLLRHDWISLSVLALAGLGWNLAVVLLLAPRFLPPDWFERAIIEFGQATGVAASGLLLLRMADPDDRSDALPAFSIKQLLLQPFLAGGVITVVAPLAIDGWGLPAWTLLCLGLVVLWIGLGLVLGRR
ncbi:MAG: sodium:solute symporter [Cyanobium sp.]|nr:MAG: sodium:solute symporter [Cyanobium sp.]